MFCLTLYPKGGLANRMSAIDSAVNFCTEKNVKLNVKWYKDWGMNCDWNELFCPLSFVNDKPLPKWIKMILNSRQSQKYNRSIIYAICAVAVDFVVRLLGKFHILCFLDMQEIREFEEFVKKRCLFGVILSWDAFYPQEKFHNELFIINDTEILQSELAKISSHTVGVHIRRTDNPWSIAHSPLELFEKKMRQEMDYDTLTDFYICSDDLSVKEHFRYGIWKDKVKMPEGIINRGSKEGIVQAACEMFALSKTQKIYGSYWSSFGDVAAKLGNIEIEICTNSLS